MAAISAVTLASCVVINTDKPGEINLNNQRSAPIIRGALSGQKQILVSFYATAPDCTSLGYPTLKVAKPPRHGEVSIEQGNALAVFGIDDARHVCNGQSLPATVIYYTSEPDFKGTDSVEFENWGSRCLWLSHLHH